MKKAYTSFASADLTETERNAYNTAVCEFGLESHGDANTYNELRTIARQKEPVCSYLESQHPHLLGASDVDFLVSAIDSKRIQFKQMTAVRSTIKFTGIGAAERTMFQHWIRYSYEGTTGFGTLSGDRIDVYRGNMFASPEPTGKALSVSTVKLLMPTQPTKVIALWNNFAALGEKLGLAAPAEPLYFLKAPNSFANPGDVIRQPRSENKVVYEGELGVVIGRTAVAVTEQNALDHVFGYTCANDVTAADVLNRDALFTQWVRAKGFDTFCPMGPAIATGLDATKLVVHTTLNGSLRQDFPISDMRFSVSQLVSLISADMTLFPGDVILCGTSIGVGSMKPGSDVEVEIAGIGTLKNRYE